MRHKKFLLIGLFLLEIGVGRGYSLTLGEIETRVRQQVRDTATDSSLQRYSDTVLDGFINEGVKDVVNQTDALDATTSYTLTAGTTFYQAPSDFIAVRFAYFRKNSSSSTYILEEKNERSFWQSNPDWQKQTGVPVNYFTRNSTYTGTTYEFAVYPIPSTTTHLGTITVYYIQQTTDMTSDSDIPFDSLQFMVPYHDVLVNYATARIKMIEGKFDESQAYIQLYLNGLKIMTTQLNKKPNWNPSFSGATK